jgi:putative copper resistance protein D
VEAVAVLTRLAQYLAVAVLGGASAFRVYGVAPADSEALPLRLARVAAAFGVVGLIGWLMTETGQVGEAADALRPAQVWSVAVDTGFGRAALVRLGLLVAAGLLLLARRPPWAAVSVLGLAAAASFAWTGHGAMDDGWAGTIHLTADVLHLLAASVWIGALAALAGLVRDPARAAVGLQAFSRIGVGVVAVVLASGLANSWFVVGLDSVRRLPASPYGVLLIAKLALFAAMLALAAANRWTVAAALERDPTTRAAALSVGLETALAVAVLGAVAWMGTLPPPVHG